MKYYDPPATSPYGPLQRAQVHQPILKRNALSTSSSFVMLYFILKFWDSPFLQKIYKQLIQPSILSANCNGTKSNRLLKLVSETMAGKYVAKGGKYAALSLARCLVKLVALSRVDKIGILEVPVDIKKWVAVNVGKETVLPASGSTREIQHGVVSENYDITKECREIDLVLKYWFGQFNPEKSQKQLWMIASSSIEHMRKVDAEISETFGNLLASLSGKENLNRQKLWAGNSEHTSLLYGWRGKLAAIIVLDQMSRHIHRHFESIGRINNSLPEQNYLDLLAYEISTNFQKEHKDEISCGMIPTPMMIFALMPLRHRSTLQSVGYVQSKVEEIALQHEVDMNNIIRRFRRATNRRMAVLQDEARKGGRQTRFDSTSMGCDEDEKEACPPIKKEFVEDDILEFHQFHADMAAADKYAVVRTVANFLEARGIRRSKNKQEVRDIPVVVSLSGGVDSMVIASILAYLRDAGGFSRLFIAACHIDYGNRPESATEASFVEHYANEILKLDKCIIRRINEVTRGVTKRDEYEQVSRHLRYDLYRQIRTECITECTQNNPQHTILEVGVMLGHHRGDVVENVISNSNKGSGPLDLSGMTALSQNDGVTIYRPLLPLQKTDVYDYSHKFGVPYFKDTTPHWSTRGKLRNKLVPLLEEIYGDGCLQNLACLAEESDEARDLFNKTALQPFLESVKRYPMGIIFGTREFSNQGSYFWKIVLRDVLHSAGLGMFGDKATESFLKRVYAKKMTSGWLQCRRDYAVYLMDDGRVAVLYPDSFPWRKAEQYGPVSKVVPFGEPTFIGPWEVSADVSDDRSKLKNKAFVLWEEFMSGRIQYSVEVPCNHSNPAVDDDSSSSGSKKRPVLREAFQVAQRGNSIKACDEKEYPVDPLELVESFTKQSRPLAWKGSDLKIQSTLPLLGNGKTALNKWVPGDETLVATVTLVLKRDQTTSSAK